jgi:serine/threonine protein kinase
VLNDGWTSKGIEEAANLLRDIASALAFIQGKQLVHGDVKPDNIGFEDGRYILLDFGICRSEEAFSEDSTPTGSLRTRAPELLLGIQTHSHASDLWALGATVYNAVTGRFPLLDVGEQPPRVSDGSRRKVFEKALVSGESTERVVCQDESRFSSRAVATDSVQGAFTGSGRERHIRGLDKDV